MLTSFSTFLEDKRETDILYDLAVEAVAIGFPVEAFCQWYWNHGQFLAEGAWGKAIGTGLGALAGSWGGPAGAVIGGGLGYNVGNWLQNTLSGPDPAGGSNQQSQQISDETNKTVDQAHQALTALAQAINDPSKSQFVTNSPNLNKLRRVMYDFMRDYGKSQAAQAAYQSSRQPMVS